jgi:chromosome segregation ATPase
MLSLQRENDELHETLAQKQLQNESLRTDLHSLQSKFDTLTIEKAGLEGRLEQTNQELQLTRALMTNAPLSDPMFLEGEVARLTKLLESKAKDFDFVTLRYQESSAAASESATEVVELKKELESLKIKLEMDVKAVSWEGEKKVLMEKVSGLEEKCKLLEERAQRVQKEA